MDNWEGHITGKEKWNKLLIPFETNYVACHFNKMFALTESALLRVFLL